MSVPSVAPAPLLKIPVSPEPLYRLLFGRPITQLLYAALDLNVFEALASRPKDFQTLCAELHLPIHSAEMMINACVAIGLLKKEESLYSLTPLSHHYLVRHHPLYLGGLLEHFRHQVFPAWDHVKEAIQQDKPQIASPNTARKRGDVFQATQQLDRNTELFIAAMHNFSVSDGLVLAESFDFSRFKRLVDIGGGSGALCLALASRFPQLETLVLDRPQVCALADKYIAQTNLGNRVRSYPSDAFKGPYPKNVDVILMSLFIHAFGLEKSTPILKHCWEILPPGGCLLIFEPVLAPTRIEPLNTLLSSLNMLVCTPSGGDVTADDYLNWLQDNGFTELFYKPLPCIRHLMGGYKPPVS